MLKSKCKHKHTMVTVGKWGPHRAKRVCCLCGKYIKWESRKPVPIRDLDKWYSMKHNRKMEVI